MRSIVILSTCLFLMTCECHSECYTSDFKESQILNFKSDLTKKDTNFCEFKFTDKELLEVSKWQDKTANDLWKDAFKCDRAALYMGGMCFLTGKMGFTIDVEKADLLFSRSASFGFKPSIKQIIHKSIEDDNPFLAMVYSNLLASMDHKEYVIPYHEFRKGALDKLAEGVFKEIERIAAFKSKQINDNQEKLAKTEDKEKLFLEMSFNGLLIDSRDSEFGLDYWIRFSKFQVETEKEASRFQLILQENYKNFQKQYKVSKENLTKALDLLKNDKEFNSLRMSALKDAIKGIDCTEKFINAMDSFQQTPNENLRNIARKYSLLCRNAKSALEKHQKFFLSPSEFLSSDYDIEALDEYYTRIEIHIESKRRSLKN